MKAAYTPHHSTYLAHRISLEGRGEDAFAKSLSTARVETKPHQVDAALFALHSPLSKGVILADEVGLGKTIEASLVIAQCWAERRRRVPAGCARVAAEAVAAGAAREILPGQPDPGGPDLERGPQGRSAAPL